MNIIIPMAGMGKRLRPHTLTVPKPLIPIAGKAIVHHLVEDIAALMHEPLNQIVFVTGRFGEEAESMLLSIASSLGATGKIAYQDEALGTAHAVWCAREALDGKVIVAFADTLFRADFKMDDQKDGVLWVKQIDDPSSFGVVKLDEDGNIRDFIEKPKTFVSDLAMIGIYYFKEGKELAKEIQFLLDNSVTKGGEYQLPDALKRLTERGLHFAPGKVDEWMDCGNAAVTIETNEKVLMHKYPTSFIDPSAFINQSVVIAPCFIGAGVKIDASVIGPGVSIGSGSTINNTRLKRSIVQKNTRIEGEYLINSMIGNQVSISVSPRELSLGDFNQITKCQ
jgi:glucose-1-phosphate thymidylyltransferase